MYFLNKIHYATFSPEALKQVLPDDLKFYATVPENAAKVIHPDWTWLAVNQDMLDDRFNRWISK